MPNDVKTFRVDLGTEIVVRWTDADGPREVVFPDTETWGYILTMPNADWGEMFLRNPETGEEFLWCSAKRQHRYAARRAMIEDQP
jgi:hypothetical protein